MPVHLRFHTYRPADEQCKAWFLNSISSTWMVTHTRLLHKPLAQHQAMQLAPTKGGCRHLFPPRAIAACGQGYPFSIKPRVHLVMNKASSEPRASSLVRRIGQNLDKPESYISGEATLEVSSVYDVLLGRCSSKFQPYTTSEHLCLIIVAHPSGGLLPLIARIKLHLTMEALQPTGRIHIYSWIPSSMDCAVFKYNGSINMFK